VEGGENVAHKRHALKSDLDEHRGQEKVGKADRQAEQLTLRSLGDYL
jgi:hypothetical protein